jgi:hypothetical protein
MWYNDGGCVIGHPDSANVLISGGQEADGNLGVSVSRDTGATWTRVALSSGGADFCYSLALAPSAARTVYAAGQAGGTGVVYRSTDLGSTWARTAGSPSDTVFGLAVNPTDAGQVIAATPGGLFRTTNAGANWTLTGAGTGFRSVRFLDGHDAAAGGDSGVIFSTNGGADWYDISSGLEGTAVSCLAFTVRQENILIAGTRGASCWMTDVTLGIEETMNDERGTMNAGPTIVRGVLFLNGDCPRTGTVPKTVLLDISGRRVLDLHAGANDVSNLSPGVYFVRQEGNPLSLKVVVGR